MSITKDILYVGVNDHLVDLFEGQYKVPNGMAYNSYVILDDKTAVVDTTDARFVGEWLQNVETALGGRSPDYLIVQHMEPDHSSGIAAFLDKYPGAAVVGNAKTFAMMDNFNRRALPNARVTVKNGETLALGRHELQFVFAPMVHWPEVMVTYDRLDKVLFSADGFGKFGALDVDEPWADEAARYYIGIVGKYGMQVQNLLKAAAALDIQAICPLHGPVLSDDLGYYLGLYDKWSSYTPEEDGVLVAYTSVYGHTKQAALYLADRLKEQGTRVEVRDLARCDMADAVAQAFRLSKLVCATTTYNADIYPFMRTFIEHLTERNFQKRTVALIENGSWAPMAAKVMSGLFEKSKALTFVDGVRIDSALSEANLAQLDALAAALR